MGRTIPPKNRPIKKNKNIDKYIKIPLWLLLCEDLTHSEKILLCNIDDLCKLSENGICCITNKKLSEEMDLSQSQVVKIQTKLERKNGIRKITIKNKKHIAKLYKSYCPKAHAFTKASNIGAGLMG